MTTPAAWIDAWRARPSSFRDSSNRRWCCGLLSRICFSSASLSRAACSEAPGPCGTFLHSLSTSAIGKRSEEHTSELQSQSNLVCRLLLEKKKHFARKSSTVYRPKE